MKRAEKIQEMGRRFALRLIDTLHPSEIRLVCERNASPQYGKGVCASHDFCDANMVMHEAFIDVVGRESDPSSAADARLWSRAWDFAKEECLSSMHHAYAAFFDAHGFAYEYPGFYAADIDKDTWLTAVFDHNGSGKWETQHQYLDGSGCVADDYLADQPDFDSVEEVVMYRDFLRLAKVKWTEGVNTRGHE